MPDGDIIRGLGRLYKGAYEDLCEEVADIDDCAYSLKKALKKDIQNMGSISVALARSMGASIDQMSQAVGGFHHAMDWATLSLQFDRLAQQTEGSPYVKELVLRAGKLVLGDLRHNDEKDMSLSSSLILQRYMTEVYEARFKESIPLISEHNGIANPAVVLEKLSHVEPIVLVEIEKWVKKAIKEGSVQKIRLSPRPQSQRIDLDQDLLAG